MSPTPEHLEPNNEDGDLYDEDTGTYFCTLDLDEGLPAQMSLYKDGFWYIFKIDSRFKDEGNGDPAPSSEKQTGKVDKIVSEVQSAAAEVRTEAQNEDKKAERDIPKHGDITLP